MQFSSQVFAKLPYPLADNAKRKAYLPGGLGLLTPGRDE
jgi:hypothetical protein